MTTSSGQARGSDRFEWVYAKLAPKVNDASRKLEVLVERYSNLAKEVGYLPLAGITTSSGLLGALLVSQDASGRIDPSKLPDSVREAFEMQYPNLHEAGRLSELTLDDAQPLISGWVGKLTEIMVRDKLNSGDPISGFRLPAGHVAHLAEDPTQEGWDIRVEPSGQLFQVKSTSDLGYVRESARNLDDEGIIFITTDMAGSPDLSDLNMLLLEIDESKDEILGMLSSALDESVIIDEFGFLDDVLGPLALVFSAGSGALLVRAAYKEYQAHGSLALIRRRYGSRVVGKVAAMVSPIPFTGWAVRKWLDTRTYVNDAVRIAKMRLARANRLIASLHLNTNG